MMLLMIKMMLLDAIVLVIWSTGSGSRQQSSTKPLDFLCCKVISPAKCVHCMLLVKRMHCQVSE